MTWISNEIMFGPAWLLLLPLILATAGVLTSWINRTYPVPDDEER